MTALDTSLPLPFGRPPSKTPLRTYSRRGQSNDSALFRANREKRTFRRVQSLHDAEDAHRATLSPELPSRSLRRTQSLMVVVQSGRHASDSEYEKDNTSSSNSSPNTEPETTLVGAADNALEHSEQSEKPPTDEEDKSDDFSDSDVDLEVGFASAAQYRPRKAPVPGRTSKPVVRGRHLIYDKTPPTGYKILKKPPAAAPRVPAAPPARIGDGFSSDEAVPSGGSLSGKKRKRRGTIDGIDALELEAIRRIKIPNPRPMTKLVHGSVSSPYKAPVSYIFNNAEAEHAAGDTTLIGMESDIIIDKRNTVPAPHESAQQHGMVKDGRRMVSFQSNTSDAENQEDLHVEEAEDVAEKIIVPQSSWISETQNCVI